MKELTLSIVVFTALVVCSPTYANDKEFNGVSVFQAWVRSIATQL